MAPTVKKIKKNKKNFHNLYQINCTISKIETLMISHLVLTQKGKRDFKLVVISMGGQAGKEEGASGSQTSSL